MEGDVPDILVSDDFGRDDGIKCDCTVMVYSELAQKKVPRICGGKTFLTDNQGGGYCCYECESCGQSFGVQYDRDDDEERSDSEGSD
jgi:hypothetical protein